jgi:hypothetical protein
LEIAAAFECRAQEVPKVGEILDDTIGKFDPGMDPSSLDRLDEMIPEALVSIVMLIGTEH